MIDVSIDGYALHSGTPSLADYLRLREDSGLTPRTVRQAALALPGSWAACYVTDGASGVPAGMGRLIGDGGWYFRHRTGATDGVLRRRGRGPRRCG